MATLGETIRARREALGMTQERLAAAMDYQVRQAEISRLERDLARTPRRQRLEQLAVALRLPLDELLAAADSSGAELTVPAKAEVVDPSAALPGTGPHE